MEPTDAADPHPAASAHSQWSPTQKTVKTQTDLSKAEMKVQLPFSSALA